jgi:transposase
MRRHELSDEEWAVIEPLLPTNSRGVKRVDDRRVINGILWTGSSWRDVSERCGPRTTLYNRFSRWRQAGVWDQLLDAVSKRCAGDIVMIDSVIRDRAAIQNAITSQWSNGQITKLKLIKRQMYGRGKLDLLEARIVGVP